MKITNWVNGCDLHEYGETVKQCAENAAENDAELNGAELSDADLNGAKLNGAKLSDAKLNGAKLNDAELSDAKLNGAKLNGAKLNGAKLNGAKLNDAEINDAELSDAELSDADLNGAELNGAKLNGANFHASDMRYCYRDEDAKVARLDVCAWPVTIQDTGVYIGCKIYTRADIMAMTEERAALDHEDAPIRWRRWGKALQELVIATLGEEVAE